METKGRPPRRIWRGLSASMLAVGLGCASGAEAGIVGSPQVTLSPYTKGQLLADGLVAVVSLRWLPPTFAPPGPNDHQEVVTRDLDTSATQIRIVGATDSAKDLALADGRRYSITVRACQQPVCASTSPNGSGVTRIDATPPSGSLEINGGAVATNGRNVTLSLAAIDPLVRGVPDTSSGVTQAALDIDGDGTLPCQIFGDTSGCAVSFASALPSTLTEGDGVKTVGVLFGDGARPVTVPCQGPFCVVPFGQIDGNVSPAATDTILLDTVKPIAVASQDRFTVVRGGAVTFDAGASVDTSASASGVDPAATTWDFKDGTPVGTGAKVMHTFAQVGTFAGELRVRDRAGNVSDPRRFSVTVDPPPSQANTAAVAGITGAAAFTIDQLRVTARYARSRLSGSVAIRGSSTQPGSLQAQVRRRTGGPVLARLSSRPLPAGPFARRFNLPAHLVPGGYRISFVGPGGTLTSILTLRAPREGVIASARVTVGTGHAIALFRMAAQPVKPLRRRLTVSWTQGRRKLGVVVTRSGALIRAKLPPGAVLSGEALRAELRAGRTVVGDAATGAR